MIFRSSVNFCVMIIPFKTGYETVFSYLIRIGIEIGMAEVVDRNRPDVPLCPLHREFLPSQVEGQTFPPFRMVFYFKCDVHMSG